MIQVKYLNEEKFTDVEFYRISANVVQLKGGKNNTHGFIAYRHDDTKLGDYSKYTTIYRKVPGAYQYSCDGSVYVEPKRDVEVKVYWNDDDNKELLRPSSVKLEVDYEDVIIGFHDGWKKVYKDIPESQTKKITSAEYVDGYGYMISGSTITYTHEVPVPTEPSIEDRVSDLEIAVCEIADAMAEVTE